MSKNGILQCIIAECHLFWHQQKKRWFTVRELSTAMGFPVYVDLQRQFLPAMSNEGLAATPLCSFNANRHAAGFQGRKRTAMSHQCGNSMNVSSIGSVLLWVLAYTIDRTPDQDALCDARASSRATVVTRAPSCGNLARAVMRVMAPIRSLSHASLPSPIDLSVNVDDSQHDSISTPLTESQISDGSCDLHPSRSRLMQRTRALSVSIDSKIKRRRLFN